MHGAGRVNTCLRTVLAYFTLATSEKEAVTLFEYFCTDQDGF